MTSISSLRIDTAIKPTSALRLILYIGLTGMMTVLAWFASLSLGQYVLIMIITAAVVVYLALSRPILLHLSQPPLNKRIDQEWQLLMRTSRSDALWQAKLITIHRYHWMINFDFMIVEPYQRVLSVTVFRDQVNYQQWRELNILATVVSSKAL